MNRPIIKVENLTHSFGSLSVLKDINLSVTRGEFVTIVGPSGAGKSTLLKCVAGLLHDFSGKIFINSLEIKDYNKERRVSIVTQKYGNYPWLTVEKNIQLGFSARKSSGPSTDIEELLLELELAEFRSYFPGQLSGGMQQRVAIGRAIAQGEEIIAMDEPFGALDYLTRSNVQSFLKRIANEFDKTVLFVTHDIEEAIFLSDRILVMSRIPSSIVKEIHVSESFVGLDDVKDKYSKAFIKLRSQIESLLAAKNKPSAI